MSTHQDCSGAELYRAAIAWHVSRVGVFPRSADEPYAASVNGLFAAMILSKTVSHWNIITACLLSDGYERGRISLQEIGVNFGMDIQTIVLKAHIGQPSNLASTHAAVANSITAEAPQAGMVRMAFAQDGLYYMSHLSPDAQRLRFDIAEIWIAAGHRTLGDKHPLLASLIIAHENAKQTCAPSSGAA